MKNSQLAQYEKSSLFSLSASQKILVFDSVCYLFILLFIYTGVSKLATISTFEKVLIHYPIIGSYPYLVALLVTISELTISALLIFPATRRIGLFLSLILILIFLLYILYMFASGSDLPCSCGGIISKLSWQQHIWFNSIFLVIAGAGLKINSK